MIFRKLKKQEERELRRGVGYLIGGGAFFWSGYAVFFALDKGFKSPLWIASTVSYLVGWSVNYLLQRYWVFDNPKLKKYETEVTGRYILISAVNIPINFAILKILKIGGVTPYIGQFISAGFFTIWNYLWYRYWVFPDKLTKRSLLFRLPKKSRKSKRPKRKRR